MTMTCRIIFNVVPEAQFYASGAVAARPVAKCETHNWMFDGAIGEGELCLIGRIEQARDEAIARIREAANHAAQAVLATPDSDGGAAVAAKPNG
jgi:hypothetical protein